MDNAQSGGVSQGGGSCRRDASHNDGGSGVCINEVRRGSDSDKDVINDTSKGKPLQQ